MAGGSRVRGFSSPAARWPRNIRACGSVIVPFAGRAPTSWRASCRASSQRLGKLRHHNRPAGSGIVGAIWSRRARPTLYAAVPFSSLSSSARLFATAVRPVRDFGRSRSPGLAVLAVAPLSCGERHREFVATKSDDGKLNYAPPPGSRRTLPRLLMSITGSHADIAYKASTAVTALLAMKCILAGAIRGPAAHQGEDCARSLAGLQRSRRA